MRVVGNDKEGEEVRQGSVVTVADREHEDFLTRMEEKKQKEALERLEIEKPGDWLKIKLGKEL
jgi:hypothetical protein